MSSIGALIRHGFTAALKVVTGYAPIGPGGTEGEYRPGPWYLPVTHGWLPADVGNSMNWWQNGHTPMLQSAQLAIIEACVSAYSQTVAMCPGDHWRSNTKGGRVRVTNSALSRVLRYPNDYQTMSDFLLNAVRQLYLSGNAYAYCRRNARFEIDEIHLMDNRYCRAMIDGSGEVFYSLSGNWVVQNRFGPIAPVPQRDVLHIKLHCDQLRNPLLGQTPLMAANLETMTGTTIRQQQFQFYSNVTKPGFVLATDENLDKEQASALRDRWTEQTSGANVGGTPILTRGLKPVPIPAISNWRDAQLAEMLRLTDQDIAMAYRCPPQVIGLETRSGSYGSAEALMSILVLERPGLLPQPCGRGDRARLRARGEPARTNMWNSIPRHFCDRILRIASRGLARGVQGGIYLAQRGPQRRRPRFRQIW